MNSSVEGPYLARRILEAGPGTASGARTILSGTLPQVLPEWKEAGERWLFVTPHDDDPAVSAALTLAAARLHGVEIRVCVVTDGSMGYTPTVGPEQIVERRKAEARQSFAVLDIDDLEWFDYPDAQVHRVQGRFLSAGAIPPTSVRAGAAGLQNSIVWELRAFRPTRLLVMSAADYHPDHRMVHQESLISVFHATGDIWPELGSPLSEVPWIIECAAYAPFFRDPDIQVLGSDELFARKLEAIRAFSSQTQIAGLLARLESAGPQEYLRCYRFETYGPDLYARLFEGND